MTGFDLYEKAMALLGEEIDGEAADTAAFRRSSPFLVNLLLADLAELNEILLGHTTDGNLRVQQIETLDDEIPVVPLVALGAMPLGLAFYLLLEEDPDRAAFFYRLYQEEKLALRRNFVKGIRHPVRKIY